MFPRLALLLILPGIALAAPTLTSLDIPPREQWNANFGYCGEVSLISAGLAFGQYCSQFDARAAASPGVPQSREDSQLLPGVNAAAAATRMKLRAEEWNAPRGRTTKQFLLWTKRHILLGHPVFLGVFMNQFRFYGDTDRAAGDSEYDHIVPVSGIRSQDVSLAKPLKFLPGDSLVFSDNALWSPEGNVLFEPKFGTFARTRSGANAKTAPVYSLKSAGNYGVAILGVADLNGDTLPVRLATDLDDEVPAMAENSSQRPPAMTVKLTATVTIPDPTQAINLYLYNRFEDVPESAFNAKASSAARAWHFPPNSGTTHTVNVTIASDQVAVFRAVPAAAK